MPLSFYHQKENKELLRQDDWLKVMLHILDDNAEKWLAKYCMQGAHSDRDKDSLLTEATLALHKV